MRLGEYTSDRWATVMGETVFLRGRSEPPSPRLYGPRFRVALVQGDGRDPENLAVLHVHEHRPSGGSIGQSLDLPHIRPPFA